MKTSLRSNASIRLNSIVRSDESEPMRQITREEADRSDHIAECMGWDDCDCFSALYSHKEIYEMQQENMKQRIALEAIAKMVELPGWDLRDQAMGAIASEALGM